MTASPQCLCARGKTVVYHPPRARVRPAQSQLAAGIAPHDLHNEIMSVQVCWLLSGARGPWR
jgi:hypothetical protein